MDGAGAIIGIVLAAVVIWAIAKASEGEPEELVLVNSDGTVVSGQANTSKPEGTMPTKDSDPEEANEYFEYFEQCVIEGKAQFAEEMANAEEAKRRAEGGFGRYDEATHLKKMKIIKVRNTPVPFDLFRLTNEEMKKYGKPLEATDARWSELTKSRLAEEGLVSK